MISLSPTYNADKELGTRNIRSKSTDIPDGKITAVITVVHSLTDAAFRTISLFHDHVDEIIVLFSGTEEQLASVREKLALFSNVRTWWVYNLSWPELSLIAIPNYIKNPWMIILTDRDVPSDEFLNFLDSFPTNNVDGYFCVRRLGYLEYKHLPEWLVKYLKTMRPQYQAYLFRREKVHISGIPHTPYRVKGNLIYLNPKKYYISRFYSAKDQMDPRKFVEHWIEKERRYIFIELFTKRMTRISAINKIIEGVPFLRNHLTLTSHRAFFLKELTYPEYVIFELIRSLSMKRIGLDVYQKIKLDTLKNLKGHNSLELKLSEIFRQLDGDIVNYIGLDSIFVNKSNTDFIDLVDSKEPEVSLIKILLKRLLQSSSEENNFDVEAYIEEVRRELDINVKKHMPLQ